MMLGKVGIEVGGGGVQRKGEEMVKGGCVKGGLGCEDEARTWGR